MFLSLQDLKAKPTPSAFPHPGDNQGCPTQRDKAAAAPPAQLMGREAKNQLWVRGFHQTSLIPPYHDLGQDSEVQK